MAVMVMTLVAGTFFSAYAVSDKEMEQARATTALWYLRYANNGSDYLEKLSPASLGELEKSLKTKEKENIKAFKSVRTPSDYASWDKDKLVEYWSVTFFKSSGLSDAGKGAATRVKKKISAMTVSAPAPKEVPAEAEVPAESRPEPTATDTNTVVPSAAEIVDQVQAADSTLLATDAAENAENAEAAEKKSGGSTWIYVIALVILVGVVIWLVIFASRTMQGSSSATSGSKKESSADEDTDEDAPVTRASVAATAASESSDKSLRDKFARSLADKDEEIRTLHREIHDLRDECLRLGEENGRLTSDLNLAQRELEALRGRLRAASAVTSAASSVAVPSEERRVERGSQRAEVSKREATSALREIYLGRVNSKGLFVRADKRPVEGKTVFVLTTSDGYTGNYKILQDPDLIDLALDNPEYYLSGGCVAQDITDTNGANAIRVLSAGTAVFEDGCWRVLRKAKIAYE